MTLGNQIVRVDSLFINLSNQRVRGYDLELNYGGIQGRKRDAELAFPRHAARRELDPDAGHAARRPCRRRRLAPARGRFPQDKFTTYLTYAHGPFSIFLQERYIGGGVNDHTKVESTTRLCPGSLVTVDDNSVDSVLYTDLTFNFCWPQDPATLTGRLS